MNKLKFTVTLDREGYTIEGLEKFTPYELGIIVNSLPAVVREVKAERRQRSIDRQLFKLEAKPIWTAKEALFYAHYSPERNAYCTACDRFNVFQEMAAMGL